MQIKCLTYNIHKGLNWNNSVHILPELKEFLQSIELDFVFLQEVAGKNEKLIERFNTWVDNQYEYLADQVWDDYAYSKNAIYDHRDHGNAILSKYPILKHEVYDLTLHKREMRALLFCEVETPNGKLHLYCTHLNLLHKHRKVQYEMINEIIKENSQNNPIIFAGDLNDWFTKSQEFLTEFACTNQKLKNNIKTFPHKLPLVQLDHFYTKNVNSLELKVLKPQSELSDHLPLYFHGEVNFER